MRTVSAEERITAPIIWYSHPKFTVMDLHENHYEEVITLIKHHYFQEEPMCRSIELSQDSVSVKVYSDLIRTWMKDTCSLVAISEKSGRVIGTVIIRINNLMEKNDTYSRAQILNGEALTTIMHLINTLTTQANVYDSLGHDVYLRIYLLCVHPSYRKKGVGSGLLEACKTMASTMKTPVIAGIFTSNEHQLIAKRAGFALLSEIRYNLWLLDEEIVFDDPGVGNFSAAFMTFLMPENKSNDEDNI